MTKITIAKKLIYIFFLFHVFFLDDHNQTIIQRILRNKYFIYVQISQKLKQFYVNTINIYQITDNIHLVL